MAKKILKNRVQFTSTMDKGLFADLQQMSRETGIPITKILDRAMVPVIMAHHMEMEQKRMHSQNNIMKNGNDK